MTTTQLDSQVEAAGNGGQSVPVQLLLQPNTIKFVLELLLQTARSASRPQAETDYNNRKTFKLFWATSYQNLSASLASVPTLLANCVAEHSMVHDPLKTTESFQFKDLHPKGQYLYIWFMFPQSSDAYTITVTSTELFISAGGANGVVKTAVSSTLAGGYFTVVTAAGTTQSLPAAPYVNETITVLNQTAGDTTVSGNGHNIYYAGSEANFDLTSGAAATFVWDGTYWSVI